MRMSASRPSRSSNPLADGMQDRLDGDGALTPGERRQLAATILKLRAEWAKAQAELARTRRQWRQRETELRAQSLTDFLTGVGNRRRLEEGLAVEIHRAERTGQGLCALMADLDHFKRVNDDYGHGVGDRVLAAVGEMLRQQTRPTDVVTRFGGEEFVILLPHTTLPEAVVGAERLRLSLETTRIAPLPNTLTVSIGVAELATGEDGAGLIRRIDAALYEAKRQGRNRVVSG